MPTLVTSIEHNIRSPSEDNKIGEKNPSKFRQSQIITVDMLHDPIYIDNSKGFTRNIVRANKQIQ
jgi:hypothetical protein